MYEQGNILSLFLPFSLQQPSIFVVCIVIIFVIDIIVEVIGNLLQNRVLSFSSEVVRISRVQTIAPFNFRSFE